MADPIVLYDVDDKVGVITLNRPDKLNAISHELQHALIEAFARAEADAATSVVLLRAEGRSFCAGYDIGAKGPGRRRLAQRPDEGARASSSAARIRDDPVADEKAGDRLGAGPCTGRRVRTRDAVRPDDRRRQRDLRRTRSTVFGVGPAIVMPMIIGYKKARELLYFGDQIDAQTALDLGMVNRIVPLAELRTASLGYAKRLSLISPEALYATKRAVNRGADAAGFRTALYAGLDVVGPLYATATEYGTQFREIARHRGGSGRGQVAFRSVQGIAVRINGCGVAQSLRHLRQIACATAISCG